MKFSGVIERFVRYLDFDWAERKGCGEPGEAHSFVGLRQFLFCASFGRRIAVDSSGIAKREVF